MHSFQFTKSRTDDEASSFKEPAQILDHVYYLYKSKEYQSTLEFLETIDISGKLLPLNEIAYIRGKANLKTGNSSEAIEIFSSLVSPNSPEAIKIGSLYRLGIIHKRKMNTEHSLAFLQDSLKENSSNRHKMKVSCHLASLYILQNSFSEAETCMNLAIDYLRNAESLACLSWTKLKSGAIEQSLECIAACNISRNRNPFLYKKLKYILALCLMKKKWFSDALDVLYDISDRNYLSLSLCGVIFASVRQLTDAKLHFERALVHNDKGWEAYYNLGILNEILSLNTVASQQLQKAKDLCTGSLPQDHEHFVIPEIDIADYIFEDFESCLKHQIVKRQSPPVEKQPRGTICVKELSKERGLKVLPMVPLIGLPIVPVDNGFRVSLPFMNKLITSCQNMVYKNGTQRFQESKPDETDDRDNKRFQSSDSEPEIVKKIKRE